MLQGERELARDNRTLGNFRLEGIRPAPRGVPQVEVTFDIDANGILTVTAKDKDTGKEQKITISGSTQLSKEEIDRMVKDAQAHAEEDQRRREEVEVAQHAPTRWLTRWSGRLRELGERVPANEKARAEQLIAEIRDAIKSPSPDLARLRQMTSDLQQIAYGLTSAPRTRAAGGGRRRRAGRRRLIRRARKMSSTPNSKAS